MNRLQLDGIMSSATQAFGSAGYECIETEWNQHDKILRVFVDHENGFGLDDCLKANKMLGQITNIEESLPNGSTLEVSSPGIERPIRRLVDFEKFVGSQIQVRLTSKIQDRRKDCGRLVGVTDEGEITIDTEGGDWNFPVDTVLKANLVYEWQN